MASCSCQHGWRGSRVSVDGVGCLLVWVTCQRRWRGQRARVGKVGSVLAWVRQLQITEWRARNYRGWRIISQTLSKNQQEMNIVQSLEKEKNCVEKEFKFQIQLNFKHLSFYSVSPGYLNLNFKVVSRTDSKRCAEFCQYTLGKSKHCESLE